MFNLFLLDNCALCIGIQSNSRIKMDISLSQYSGASRCMTSYQITEYMGMVSSERNVI